jgi:hypothetical protein
MMWHALGKFDCRKIFHVDKQRWILPGLEQRIFGVECLAHLLHCRREMFRQRLLGLLRLDEQTLESLLVAEPRRDSPRNRSAFSGADLSSRF